MIHIYVFGSLNYYLSTNHGLRDALIIIGSLFIDFTLLFTTVFFCIKGKSWQWLTTLALYYGIRAIVQALFLMKFPDNDQFTYPGFPSLFVGYAHTNDFFYSGHVGITIICTYELRQIRKWIIFIGIFMSLYEAFVMLTTRGHYTMDIIFGYVMTIWSIITGHRLAYFFDRWYNIGNEPWLREQIQEKN